MEYIDEINRPLPFVKPFGLTSGAFVRDTVGLILLKNVFNCFNFYSIDFSQQISDVVFPQDHYNNTCAVIFIDDAY